MIHRIYYKKKYIDFLKQKIVKQLDRNIRYLEILIKCNI